MGYQANFDKIAVIDFGSQYTQLIARRVRENNVYSEIVSFSANAKELRAIGPKGLILSGGPASVYASEAPGCDPGIFNLGLPMLGICYGMQLMASSLGGEVKRGLKREYGRTQIRIDSRCPLFKGLGDEAQGPLDIITVWMSHGDRITKMPPGFRAVANSENSPYAAMADLSRQFYGLQFHPEVTHTPFGSQILRNFVFGACGCSPSWTPRSFIEAAVEEVRSKVGRKGVICALSGGVDSTVTALLVHRALGSQLKCIFVDNGLLRHGEAEKVISALGSQAGLEIICVDASEQFLSGLKGIIDPEEKRRVIGREFIRVFEEAAARFVDVFFLAQGTLYPDVIESRSACGPSAKIKTHHNVGGLPEEMELEVIEPLKELFKDEVRKVGSELGLPNEILWRQPFPGPGLAVRVVGEVTKERLEILRQADAIIEEEVRKEPVLYGQIWQSFAVLLPVKSVGVMGDERTYENVLAIRAVSSQDGMTADWVRLPYDILAAMSNRIINEVKGVNRVVYDISSKPPSTIEWE